MNSMPQSVKNTLWSYDTDQMDITDDKNRIILQILNHGTNEAVQWMKKTYSTENIEHAITKSVMGDWNKKSLNLWNLLTGAMPKVTRF